MLLRGLFILERVCPYTVIITGDPNLSYLFSVLGLRAVDVTGYLMFFLWHGWWICVTGNDMEASRRKKDSDGRDALFNLTLVVRCVVA